MEILTALLRTLLMYFIVLVVLRLMGKREIGKLSIFDLVVSIMMAEIAVMVIEDTKIPLIKGIVPIITLMLTQIILSYITLKSKKIRDIVEGQPAVLIANGKLRDNEMAKQRYTVDDLITQLREKNINRIADVEFAILETSGKLSVFPKPAQLPATKEDLEIKDRDYGGIPMPIIEDGRILSSSLQKINKDEKWLIKKIKEHGIHDVHQIFFASVDNKGEFFIDLKDKNGKVEKKKK